MLANGKAEWPAGGEWLAKARAEPRGAEVQPEPCGCAPHRPNPRIAGLNRRRPCLPPAGRPRRARMQLVLPSPQRELRAAERWARRGVRGHFADHAASSDHAPMNLGPREPL